MKETERPSGAADFRPLLKYRLFYVWALVWGSLVTVFAATGYLLTHAFNRHRGVFKWWTSVWARGIFAGIGLRVQCKRTTALNCDASYVFASNHQILLDIPLTAIAVDCPFGFVSKAALARMPFLGWAIRTSPSVFVDRANPRLSYTSIQKAGEVIRNGTSVIIYPEGARSYDREMHSFGRGAFLLALEAGVPIVPITILDAYLVFNENDHVARPGTVRMVVGDPISLEGMTRSDLPALMERVFKAIQEPFGEEWE